MSFVAPQGFEIVKSPAKTSFREVISGNLEEEVKPTIGVLAPLFLEWAQYEMRRSSWTIARYRESLQWVIRYIGDQSVTELHLGHLLTLRRKMEERGCREARMAGILNALRSFLKFCHDVLKLPALDYRQVRVPRIPRRDVVYLTKEEVHTFLHAIVSPGEAWERVPFTRLRFRAFVEVLLGTGARVSEALSLDRGGINFERKEARIIGKGSKERMLYFTDQSLEWLKRYLSCRWDEEEPVFVTRTDPPKRLSRDWIKNSFTVYRRRAGITKRISPHILRHTMATTLLFNGCPIGHIKELLGHERLDTTCRYYLGLDKRAVKGAHQRFLTYE